MRVREAQYNTKLIRYNQFSYKVKLCYCAVCAIVAWLHSDIKNKKLVHARFCFVRPENLSSMVFGEY